jgi:hypothetical protein
VDDASAGRHPLDVARPQAAGVTRRVPVLHAPGEQVGDRLEAAVRVIGRALGFARSQVGRPHLVEQEERVEVIELAGGEGPPHLEAGAL